MIASHVNVPVSNFSATNNGTVLLPVTIYFGSVMLKKDGIGYDNDIFKFIIYIRYL